MNSISSNTSNLLTELVTKLDDGEKVIKAERFEIRKNRICMFILSKKMWNQEKRLSRVEECVRLLEDETDRCQSILNGNPRRSDTVNLIAKPVLKQLR